MTKTNIQIIIAVLVALLFAHDVNATETVDVDKDEQPTPLQCIWFLQNCAPPVSNVAPVIVTNEVAAKQR